MKIDCYISEGCSSEDGLKKNIAEALKRESVDATVQDKGSHLDFGWYCGGQSRSILTVANTTG